MMKSLVSSGGFKFDLDPRALVLHIVNFSDICCTFVLVSAKGMHFVQPNKVIL